MAEHAAYPDQSDSVIWQQFLQGNQGAFAHIYHRFFNDLYDYGRKLGRKPDFIEDCIQDFFLYLWQHRENLSVVKNIRFYLIKSFRRLNLQNIKQDHSREKRAGIFGQSQQQVKFSFAQTLTENS